MSQDNEEDDIDGSICSIHVRNFFCHENLEINLNRNVNFIVGRNGSGKSAILTALVVGLGARASTTNRGNSLSSFVRNGANSASIEIKIKNNSAHAYKHDVYGDYITVVRTINASGGSAYKIKNSAGQVVSTKFEEVRNITTTHDIQVDNPISILNQDEAKTLHAMDAEKKYQFFRRATNLNLTEDNYNLALENCKKGAAIWSRKSEASEDLEKEYKNIKAIHDKLQSHDEIEAQSKALQNEYYWSEIAKMEKEANMLQVQFDKHNAKIDALVKKLTDMEDNFGSNSGLINGLKSELQEQTLQKSALEQELKELDSQARQAQAALRSAQHTRTKHADLLRREQRKVTDLEQEIENIDSGSTASRRAKLETAVKEAKEAAEASRARYNTARNHAAQAQQHAAAAAAAHTAAAKDAARARGDVEQLQRQARELSGRDGGEAAAVFGAGMLQLCRRVTAAADQGVFSKPPRGPIGAYIKVRDKKWGGPLEHILGDSIRSFCVNTSEDSRKLFQIMKEVYGNAPKPSVTCSQFLERQHDVSRNRVRHGGFLSALDSLQLLDPVVANFLIDNVGVEKILLVPDHAQAQNLAARSENVPENCKRIVTLDSSEYYPAPGYRCYGGAPRPARYLHCSTAERKRQLESEISEAEDKVRALDAQAEELQRAARHAKNAEREAAADLQSLMSLLHASTEAERAAAAALEAHRAPQHDVLEEELVITKEKLTTLTQQVEEFSQNEQEQLNSIQELENKMKAVKNQLGQAINKCRSLSEEIDQEQLKLEQGSTERESHRRRVAEDRGKLARLREALDEKNARVREKIAGAEMLCPRVENPRDLETITREIQKTQVKLSSIRSDGRSKAEVAAELHRVASKRREVRGGLERLKAVIDLLQRLTRVHQRYSAELQRLVARRVQHDFLAMLTVNGYQGGMNIDLQAGRLEITCTGREAAALRHAATTSSLSGGERSYSTVALVMALWAAVEVPFFFMDECDVFMDDLNRKKVTMILLKHALGNPTRQFGFLTPLDNASLAAQQRVSIHKLDNPRP